MIRSSTGGSVFDLDSFAVPLAQAYGARVVRDVGEGTTHVVCSMAGTSKYERGLEVGAKVVHFKWLVQVVRTWSWVDEEPFEFDVSVC